MVMKPVGPSMKYMSDIRPDTGVQPSPEEKTMISKSAHQKIGIE